MSDSLRATSGRPQVNAPSSQLAVSCMRSSPRVCTLVLFINPWHACAARVTVVVLFVCLSVCPHEFSHYRLRGGQWVAPTGCTGLTYRYRKLIIIILTPTKETHRLSGGWFQRSLCAGVNVWKECGCSVALQQGPLCHCHWALTYCCWAALQGTLHSSQHKLYTRTITW